MAGCASGCCRELGNEPSGACRLAIQNSARSTQSSTCCHWAGESAAAKDWEGTGDEALDTAAPRAAGKPPQPASSRQQIRIVTSEKSFMLALINWQELKGRGQGQYGQGAGIGIAEDHVPIARLSHFRRPGTIRQLPAQHRRRQWWKNTLPIAPAQLRRR